MWLTSLECMTSQWLCWHPVYFLLPESILVSSQDVGVIAITAKKYGYSTSPVHVKVGIKVQLKITAIDHDHGFKIGGAPYGASSSNRASLIFISEQQSW